jgi:hypothetical protein
VACRPCDRSTKRQGTRAAAGGAVHLEAEREMGRLPHVHEDIGHRETGRDRGGPGSRSGLRLRIRARLRRAPDGRDRSGREHGLSTGHARREYGPSGRSSGRVPRSMTRAPRRAAAGSPAATASCARGTGPRRPGGLSARRRAGPPPRAGRAARRGGGPRPAPRPRGRTRGRAARRAPPAAPARARARRVRSTYTSSSPRRIWRAPSMGITAAPGRMRGQLHRS